ncbi:unnamed protein product [Ceutorhynchus assimilis]|uniref:Uncharacterized protein n=1 Tax=Ceutorhynchus assimilis TaxID=467358 RepID=A0A9N9MVD2_9CUCU|nr:unnamed protein product [Ceutorhynchus assimilis]
MNYFKNSNPFRFLTYFFRPRSSTSETLIKPRKSKSDMILEKQPSKEVSLQKSTTSITKCQNIEKQPSKTQLTRADSRNSLHQSKTSSEHSFKGAMVRKNNVLNFQAAHEESKCIPLDKELRRKIDQLQASFNLSRNSTVEKNRQRLKRAYPWQNFNLHNISQTNLDVSKRISSEIALASNNSSAVTLVPSKQQLKEIRKQEPLFKSILQKSAVNPKPSIMHKKVAFNSITTIYESKKMTPKPSNHQEKSREEIKKCVCKCFGRCEPLKEEHSFMSLYLNKRPRKF